jgi:hypothetical protein
MSDLTNALNRIMTWLGENSPNSASGFQPGLSSNVIEEKLNILPFCLSKEVYELYGWRNGDESYSMAFGYLWMLNLDRACEFSDFLNDDNSLDRRGLNEPQYLLPLFDFDGEYFAVQGGDILTNAAPIFHVSDCYDLTPAFINLTGMMLAIAECYETGVYAVTEHGLEVVDGIKFGEIRRKYNPGMVDSLYADGW